MILNLIVGKNSNLSKILYHYLENVILISTLDSMSDFTKIVWHNYTKINIIFNNFQSASMLNNLDTPKEYIYRSIFATSEILEYIKQKNITINKIIYTSSSSVYGNNIFCSESDQVQPLNLHASLKVSNEKLIEKFAQDNNIDYTIARVFNMYGGEDHFSIISKIIRAYQNNEELTIVNNGNGIRDFIHIEDVVTIYKKLLDQREIPYINVGTGEGVSIKNIFDYLKNNDIFLKSHTIQREELKISTANNEKLVYLLGSYNFKKVEAYILGELK